MTEKLLPDGSYLSKIYEMLNRIEQQEQEPMEAAAEAAYHPSKTVVCCTSFQQVIPT